MDANPSALSTYRHCAVSIHAPVMDAKLFGNRKGDRDGFNPRARDGREQSLGILLDRRLSFNPRARDGREAVAVGDFMARPEFQSTRP